ncbi:hypothetical protein HDU76_009907 [Blyttiomyces sp. JEL0837]|nr:hypothetical protein HDU76_009907 [Blyttiomyces sp. JEL0837]
MDMSPGIPIGRAGDASDRNNPSSHEHADLSQSDDFDQASTRSSPEPTASDAPLKTSTSKRKKRRRAESGSGGGDPSGNRGEGGGASNAPRSNGKKKKFNLAPANWLDRLFFVWGVKLISLVLRAEDILEVHLHLKSTESAKVTGDKLEEIWLLQGRVGGENEGDPTGEKHTPTGDPADNGNANSRRRKKLSTAASVCYHQLTIQTTKVGIQCRAALMVLIYRKALRLSFVKGGVSDIVNLIAHECNRIAEASVTWHLLWSALAEFLVILALAFVVLGFSALPALAISLVILLPLQMYLAISASNVSLKFTSLITKRVHLMSEALTAIKLIKFYAWEAFYLGKLSDARKTEVKELWACLSAKIGIATLIFTAPVFATLGCLALYLKTYGRPLDAGTAFVTLSLFNTLRYPLLMLPTAIRTLKAANVSLHNLENFLVLPEVDKIEESPPPTNPTVVVEIQNANFTWDGDLDHPHIFDLNLQIERGKVVAIVGDLPSGRSLLAAVMGQIKRTSGTHHSYGACGYVPQEPWLINATIRDNILFGLDYDEARYTDTVRMCGLTRDLMLMSNGDESIVTELNLSQSQKQRLSLARCIYHNPDVVLLEDCLSDFDHATARRLFKECIKGNLAKTKAVLFLTQQKQYLKDCDHIIVLKNGRIVEEGAFDEMKARKVNFSAWVSDFVPIEDDPSGELEKVNEIRLDGPVQATMRGPLSNVHLAARLGSGAAPGATPFPKARSPFAGRLASSHVPSPLATGTVITNDQTELRDVTIQSPEDANEMTIRALMALNNGSIQHSQLNEQTISKMIERSQLSVLTGNTSRPPANFSNQDPVARTIEANQLTIHSMHGFEAAFVEKGIITRSAILRPYRSYFIYLRGNGVAIYTIIMLIFILIAQGLRLLSDVWLSYLVDDNQRFDKDLTLIIYFALVVGITVAMALETTFFAKIVLKNCAYLHDRAVKAVLRAPMFLYASTPLGQILSNFARHLFLADELLPESALQFIVLAPMIFGVFVLVSVLVPWWWSIIPFFVVAVYFLVRKCSDAESRLRTLEASNKSPMFAHLSTTLEGLFSIRLYCAQDRFDAFNRSLIDADHKALYSLHVVKTVQALYLDLLSCFLVFFTALLLAILSNTKPWNAGIALVNVLELPLFLNLMIRTGGDVHFAMSSIGSVHGFIENAPSEPVRLSKEKGFSSEWPPNGAIEFKQVILRYHRYGVAILKSVSFRIHGGEKIGIVGRSGSGKTSILNALLRITEHTEGEILIDDVNTRTLSLGNLRGRIAVIPQEPVLLSGTVRENLDPFGLRTDEEIWLALKDVHLGTKIEEMPLQLESTIVENGRKFELAERQLFCIARAILLRTKIVIFDEPVTAGDNDSDALIQSTIRNNFTHATVIVLASRFRMISEADRIIVMDGGRVVEFDTPLALLDNPKSKFCLMASQTGDIDLEKLRKIAMSRMEKQQAASSNSSEGRLSVNTEHRPSRSTLGLAGESSGSPTLNGLPHQQQSMVESYSSISTLQSSQSGQNHIDSVSLPTTAMLPQNGVGGTTGSVRSTTASNMPKSLKDIFGDKP